MVNLVRGATPNSGEPLWHEIHVDFLAWMMIWCGSDLRDGLGDWTSGRTSLAASGWLANRS